MSKNTEITQESLEFIERCLNKTANTKELEQFETRLKHDSEFSAQVSDIKTLLFGIEAQSLKEKLDDFHKDLDKTQIKKIVPVKSLHFRKIAVAAILIIALGGFWFFSGNANEKLYAKYFTPDPGLPTTMSSTDNYEFFEAMVNYKRGDYKTAISKWETLYRNKPNNDTLSYFIGVAYLANKNENTAIPFLENVTENTKFILVNDAHYYLGLAYLKVGNLEKAKANFKHSNNENSKALLSKLNN